MSKIKESTPESSSNWIVNFAPKTLEDLAVHAKKLEEVHNWFLHCDKVKKPPQLCMVSGPSGCAKTAAVRLIADKCKYEIQEWINPIDQELIKKLGDQLPDEGKQIASQVETFRSFLFRASRYKSLVARHTKRVLLVEDFPNALISDAALFEQILEDYVNYGLSPLIFILTDSKCRSLDVGYKLFTDQIQMKFRFNHITFNPIASTLMQKAMKRFCTIMRHHHSETYKVPPQNVIDSIVISAQGDIRNALINLHFSSISGAPTMRTVAFEPETDSKGRVKRKKLSKLESVGRNESITMLHALGRVFNPKYTLDKKFVHSPEEIAEAFSTEPKRFTDLLHGNYLKHFSDISDVTLACDSFCQADVMFNEYRDEALVSLGFNLVVRSVMVANSTPVSGWLPIQAKKRYNTNFVANGEAFNVIGLKPPIITKKLYTTEYSTLTRRILEKRRMETH